MAKKTNIKNTKDLGTVSRGVDNQALTPGGPEQPQAEVDILDVINGNIDEILTWLTENQENHFETIISSINNILPKNFSQQLFTSLDLISDELIAIVGCLYGDAQANINKNSKQYLSTLEKSSIYSTLNKLGVSNTEEEFIDAVTSTDISNLVDSINNLSFPKPDTYDDSKLIDLIEELPKTTYDDTELKEIVKNLPSQLEDIFNVSLDNNFIDTVTSADVNNLADSINNLAKNEQIAKMHREFIDKLNNIVYDDTFLRAAVKSSIEDVKLSLPQIFVDGLNVDVLIDELSKLKDFSEVRINIKNSIFDDLKLISEVLEYVANTLHNNKIDTIDVDNFLYATDKLNQIDLSKINVPNGAVKDISSLYSILDGVNSVDPKKLLNVTTTVDGISRIVSTISKIDLDKIPEINKKDIKKIQSIADISKALLDIKVPKEGAIDFTTVFSAEQAEAIKSYVKAITENVDYKNATGIGDVLNGIININTFDKSKYKDTVKTLKRIAKLTKKPTTFSKLGLSNTGLIWQIIHNLSEAANTANVDGQKDVKSLGELFKTLVGINSLIDEKSMSSFKKSARLLNTILDEEHLLGAITNINKIDEAVNEELDLTKLENNIDVVIGLSDNINLPKALQLLASIYVFDNVVNSIGLVVKSINKLPKLQQDNNLINIINDLLIIGKGLNNIEVLDKLSATLLKVLTKLLVVGKLIDTANASFKSLIKLFSKEDKNSIHALINSLLELGTVKSAYVSLGRLNSCMLYLLGILSLSTVLAPLALLLVATIPVLNIAVKGLVKLVDTINKIPDLKDVTKTAKELAMFVTLIGGVMVVAALTSGIVLNNLAGMLMFAAVFSLFTFSVIGSISKASKNLKDTKVSLKSLLGIILGSAAIMLLGATIMTPKLMVGAALFAVSLGTFILLVLSAYNLANRLLGNKQLENIKTLKEIIIGSAALMMIGAGFMMIPRMFASAMSFTVALTTFIMSVAGAYWVASKLLTNSIKNAKTFERLVVISAGTLLLGGGLLVAYPWMNLAVPYFGVLLTAFIFGITAAFGLAQKLFPSAMKGAKDLGILVALTTASLFAGAGLLVAYPWMNLAVPYYGVLLSVFIFGIAAAYGLANTLFPSAMKGAKGLGILVALSTASLLAGGYLITKYPWLIPAALAFGLVLSAFILTVVAAYGIGSALGSMLGGKGFEGTIKSAKQLGILIALSTATLLIGGAFMLIPGLPAAALKFGLILGGFILLISFAFSLGGDMKKAAAKAIGLSILVVISGAMLLVGASIMNEPGMIEAALGFVGAVLIMTGGMAIILGLLGTLLKGKELLWGTLALAVCVGTAYLMTQVIKELANALTITNLDTLWDGTKLMFTILGSFALAVAALGGIAAISGGVGAVVLAAGTAMLVAIIETAKLAAEAMSAIAHASNDIANAKTFDVKKLKTIISDFVSVSGEFLPLAKPGIRKTMKNAKKSVIAMTDMVKLIGSAIHYISSLMIPEFDENGKVKGYIKLGNQDFHNAAENIKTIITTIGSAILETYDRNPQMFTAGNGFKDFLRMDTPFTRVIKSCNNMGNMIKLIADGVKEYAAMKIPEYDSNGKIVGYRKFTDADFDSAARNIGLVITTLGNAIVSVYESDKHNMFAPNLFGNTIFGRVINSSSKMGNMIAEIAKGVKEYASMTIPIYDEQTGEIKGYRQFGDNDFKQAAKNVGEIITCVGGAIVDIYQNDKKGLFKQNIFTGDSPFSIIMESMKGSGMLISEAIMAIMSVNAMSDDLLNKLDDEEFRNKISNILLCIASSIHKVYEANPKLFESASKWKTNKAKNSVFTLVRDSLSGSGDLVNEAVDTINKVQDLLKQYDGKTASDLKNDVETILTCLGSAIESVYDGNEKLFKSASIWKSGAKAENTKFGVIQSALNNSTDLVRNTIDAIKAVQESSINIEDLVVNEKDGNSGKLYNLIKSIITTIPNVIDELSKDSIISNPKQFEKSTNKILDTYKHVQNLLSTCIGVYVDAYERTKDIVAEDLHNKIITLLVSIPTDINNQLVNLPDIDKNKLNNSLESLKGIREQIEDAVKLENYSQRIDDFNNYIKTVNDLDITKADKLVSLMDAMNRMASNLGNLEKFTDVLANKVTTVMSHVATSLDNSAKTINTAKKLQEDRHDKIKDALKQLRDLMNKPLKVDVTHQQDENSNSAPLSPGSPANESDSSSKSSNIGGSSSGGYSNGGTTTSGGTDDLYYASNKTTDNVVTKEVVDKTANAQKQEISQSSGGGISEKRAREIAREQIEQALHQLAGNNNLRGGGSRSIVYNV